MRRTALPQRHRVCAAAADAPETCLASALAALAAGDEGALLPLLLPLSDDRAAVSGDTGVLSAAAHALDPASRRVLPRHAQASVLSLLQVSMQPLLRSYVVSLTLRAVSALQLPPRGAAARVAATSASGEAGVFTFALERVADDAGAWRVAAAARDDAADADAAAALALPHCGVAPEVVALAFLARLAAGGVAAAGALATARGVEHCNVSRGGRSTNGATGGGELRSAAGRFASLLCSPAYALLVRHVSAVWAGPPALDAGGGWTRAVRITGCAAAANDSATIWLRLALTPLREPDPDGGGECDEAMQAGDDAAGGAVCWRVGAIRRIADS